MDTTQNHNNNGNRMLKSALAVSVIIIAFLGYLLYDYKKTNGNQEQVINEKVEQLATTKSRLDSVAVQLDAKIAEITALGGKIDELVAARTQLEKDKKALKNAKFYSVKQYDAKIADYVALLTEKDNLIAQLKTENEDLTAQTVTLSKEKDVLVQEKQSFEVENTGLKNEKEKLNQKVADYSTRNEQLVKKVKTGAQLKAINFEIYAVKSNGKVIDGGKYRARRVDQLKFVFTLPSNVITEQGKKEIMVRIIDDEGAVITDSATGSGVFDFAGKELAYTTKETVAYTNNDQNVEMNYSRGMPYRSGVYSVELYSEGFKIGTGSFTIK